LVLLPFGALLVINVVLRLFLLGGLGGYSNLHTTYSEVFLSGLATAFRMIVSPINPLVLGSATEQVVAALVGVALLVGLIFYGPALRRILLVVVVWLVVALLPVLNLLGNPPDLGQNRLLYLAAAGYCVGVAALFYTVFMRAHGRWCTFMNVSLGVVLLLGVVVSWLQLRPWSTATVIAADVDAQLARLIPLQPHPEGMIWYTQDRPDNYEGALIYRLGLGVSRTFSDGVVPWVEDSLDVTRADLSKDHRDSYALRFAYDDAIPGYRIIYAAGESTGAEPPTPTQVADGSTVWDFRNCATDAQKAWHLQQAQIGCQPGIGLHITSTGGDPQLIGPDVSLNPTASGAQWVRISVAATFPNVSKPEPYLAQLFWREPNGSWSERSSRMLTLRQDGKTHIYWTFISVDQLGSALGDLRFDPVNGTIPADVSWIAVDLVH